MAVYLAFDRYLSRVANPTPKCTLGLALVAKGSRPPVYDALTVALCFSNAREFDAQRAQAALESLGDMDRRVSTPSSPRSRRAANCASW